MNLTAFNKAFVPLVVMGFAYLGTKFGINFGIGEAEALILLGLITSWLTFLIPNKDKALTVEANNVKIEVQDPEVKQETTVVIEPEVEAASTLIRRVVK